LRSSSTPVAPPSGHPRPPIGQSHLAPLLCQRARWPDPTPRSPPGRSAPGTAAAERTPRAGATVLAAAAPASVRGWEAHKGRGQADQAAGVAARLLPVAASRRRPGRRRSVCPGNAHETPGDPRAGALPSTAKQRFDWLALSWGGFLITCLAEAALDGTETGHIRDAERDGGGRGGGHLPRLMATPSLLATVPGWSSFAGQERMSGITRR
jgi:hypothetical protein